jgi:hypothetical protein
LAVSMAMVVFAPFVIIILLLSFFRQKFIRHISRRLLNGNQWNFTGMLSTMSRCADYFLIYLETKFRPKRRNFVPWIPWQRPPFWIFSTPPKAATHYAIWAKFGFQVDYDVANWYSLLVCYGARNWMKLSRIIFWHVYT